MKSWLVEAAAIAVLAAASPAAWAAPPDASTRQDQHHDKKANASAHDSDRGRSGAGNVAKRDHATNSSKPAINEREMVRKREVTTRRPAEVHRGVAVQRPVKVHRKTVVRRPVEVHHDAHVNRRVDVSSLRRNFNAPKRFHWNAYRRPPGWYAHRWSYGERLPRAWFARDYWISSFLMFGLIAPPDGYVWVRVGDDALLIDEDTGEIVQVVYNVFY